MRVRTCMLAHAFLPACACVLGLGYGVGMRAEPKIMLLPKKQQYKHVS